MARKVSEKLNLPLATVVLAYRSYWDNIKVHIDKLDMINIENESDCENMKLSFNIQSIGKLFTYPEKIIRINNDIKKHNEINTID